MLYKVINTFTTLNCWHARHINEPDSPEAKWDVEVELSSFISEAHDIDQSLSPGGTCLLCHSANRTVSVTFHLH